MASLRILHPLVKDVIDICDLLRGQKRESRPKARQSGATLFAPSFAGKSTAVEMYLETVIVDECYERGLFSRAISREKVLDGQRLVLHISLPPNAHMGSLMYALLEKLGDLTPSSGSIDERRARAYILMRRLGVELLIFDEIDHLRVPPPIGHNSRETATAAHNQLKMFMNDGWPVLFVGIPEARRKLFSEDQTRNREMYPIIFNELDLTKKADVKAYREFCSNLGIALHEKGLTSDVFVFGNKDIYLPLASASNALFGVTAKLTQTALERAYRQGRSVLERADLIVAADMFALVEEPEFNPFRVYDRRLAEKEAVSE